MLARVARAVQDEFPFYPAGNVRTDRSCRSAVSFNGQPPYGTARLCLMMTLGFKRVLIKQDDHQAGQLFTCWTAFSQFFRTETPSP